MPALIAHCLFGEEALGALPAGIIEGEDQRSAFIVGTQGPDPMFFRWGGVLSNTRACMTMGKRLHGERMTSAFTWLRDGVSHLPAADAGIGRAFALGMLAHYALDRTAHPFIYAQQYKVVDLSDDLADAEGEVHALEEAEIDVAMLWRMRGLSCDVLKPVSVLDCPESVEVVAGALVSHMVRRTFGEEFGASWYGQCLTDMRRVYQVIEPAGSAGANLVGTLERGVRSHSRVQALAHRIVSDGESPWMNDGHEQWFDPFTGAPSNDSFEDLFARALEEWPAMAHAFIDGGDLAAMTGHRDYEGCVLADDEAPYPEDAERVRPFKGLSL